MLCVHKQNKQTHVNLSILPALCSYQEVLLGAKVKRPRCSRARGQVIRCDNRMMCCALLHLCAYGGGSTCPNKLRLYCYLRDSQLKISTGLEKDVAAALLIQAMACLWFSKPIRIILGGCCDAFTAKRLHTNSCRGGKFIRAQLSDLLFVHLTS